MEKSDLMASEVIGGLCSYKIGSDQYKAEVVKQLTKKILLVNVMVGRHDLRKFTLRKNGYWFEVGSNCGYLDFESHEENLDPNF